MRTDRKLKFNSHETLILDESRRRTRQGFSLSGNERNHLFFSAHAKQFYDIAGVSGLDHPGDSRSFAILDYDRDGWQDIALVNANASLFQLYRNQIGDTQPGQDKIIAVRFVGGNHTDEPSTEWSNRDGYGALVTVRFADMTLKREHRAGEGFAAQNSATMLVGIGEHHQAESIVVRFPSGKIQRTPNVPAGTLLTVYENSSHSPSGEAFALEPYRINPPTVSRQAQQTRSRLSIVNHPLRVAGARTRRKSSIVDPKLRIYTTMATWCAACKRELPQLQRLRTLFTEEQVDMLGIPVDKKDNPEELSAYVTQYEPAYTLLVDLTSEQVASVQAIVKAELFQDGLPATIITDGDGYVLRTLWGVPSVSEIRKRLNGENR